MSKVCHLEKWLLDNWLLWSGYYKINCKKRWLLENWLLEKLTSIMWLPYWIWSYGTWIRDRKTQNKIYHLSIKCTFKISFAQSWPKCANGQNSTHSVRKNSTSFRRPDCLYYGHIKKYIVTKRGNIFWKEQNNISNKRNNISIEQNKID